MTRKEGLGSPRGIKGFVETSFVDWPGKIVSVIFLGGCNYRCPLCHNPRLVKDQDQLADWPFAAIMERLCSFRGWIDGVCVTGGEPTVNPALMEILTAFKEGEWPVKLDTNGSRPEAVAERLEKGLAAAFSVDVKAPFEDLPYRRNGGPGADCSKVKETLRLLAASGLPVETRTTVHPSLLSVPELRRLKAVVGELFGAGHPHRFQNCRTGETLDPSFVGTVVPSQEDFKRMLAEAGL